MPKIKEISVEYFNLLMEQSRKAKEYESILLKIKESYESQNENELDELLYSLFSNEPNTDESY